MPYVLGCISGGWSYVQKGVIEGKSRLVVWMLGMG